MLADTFDVELSRSSRRAPVYAANNGYPERRVS